jgi:tRNA pseudouridine32 synthase/23S rRNA pseudouridine746 synthase
VSARFSGERREYGKEDERPQLKPPLPTIEGVAPSCLRISSAEDRNILEYLGERFPRIDAKTWIDRMNGGRVVDEFGNPLGPESRGRRGSYVFYYRELEEETPIPFEERVLYRDEHILAVDKPHFLPVVPSGRFLRETLLVRLKKDLSLEHLVPIHRIDRETAGVVIFSHDPATRGRYASLFQEQKVEKVYEALAPTLPGMGFPLVHRSRLKEGKPFFRMEEVEGRANSETRIEVIEVRGDVTLYRLIPATGRKHQLRVHMAALGIPIINDRFYPEAGPAGDDDILQPLKLLARSVSFPDPLTGRSMRFESARELS